MTSKVYWCGIEYSYKKGSPDFGKLKGGFVYVFVKASDVREALEKILNELNEKHLNPIEVDFVSPYDEDMEWETTDQTSNYTRLFEEASNSTEVIFDDFYAYEKE